VRGKKGRYAYIPGKAFPLTAFVMAGLVYKRWVVPTIIGRGGVSKSERCGRVGCDS